MTGELEEQRNLLDYLYVLVKWRRLIVVSFVAVSLITAGISLVLPKAWTARTIIMPPEEAFDQFELSALQSSGLPANLTGLVGGATPADRLKRMLETDRVMGAIVDQFDLIGEYDAPHRELAIQTFDDHIVIELEREGALIIEVTASRPGLAADLANALIGELDSFNRQLKSQQARKLREFLAVRLELGRREFERSSLTLLSFKQARGIAELGAQTEAIVEVAQSIVEELVLLEVKLGVISHQVKAEHETRQLLELEIEELHKQLRVLIEAEQGQKSRPSLGPPLEDVPELGFELAMLTLDLRIKEEIARFLGAKLEEARYKEALNTPTLQVLDVATPPVTRSGPRRTLMVLLAAGVSLILGTVLAFVFESWSRLGAQNQDKIEAIKQLFHTRS